MVVLRRSAERSGRRRTFRTTKNVQDDEERSGRRRTFGTTKNVRDDEESGVWELWRSEAVQDPMGRTATIYRVEDAGRAERFGIEPQILGGAPGVWRRLRRALPGLYARGWEGWIAGDGWRMKLSTWRCLMPSSRGGVDSIQIDVHGSGDPVPMLVKLCRAEDWSLFDDAADCFVDLDDTAGMSWHGAPLPGPSPLKTPITHLVADLLGFSSLRREVVLLDLDGPPGSGLPGSLRRFPLGYAADVRERIECALPDVRWIGRRGRVRSAGARMDLCLRTSGLIDTLRVSVCGPDADGWLRRICEPNGWSALEPHHRAFSFLHETARERPALSLPANVIALRPR